jgi:hypothetical protein
MASPPVDRPVSLPRMGFGFRDDLFAMRLRPHLSARNRVDWQDASAAGERRRLLQVDAMDERVGVAMHPLPV